MRSALESARTIPGSRRDPDTRNSSSTRRSRTWSHKISIPKEAEEWFVNAALIKGAKRSWKKTARHPAMLATALAMLVLAGTGIFFFVERLHEFPGSETAKKMLVAASIATPLGVRTDEYRCDQSRRLFFHEIPARTFRGPNSICRPACEWGAGFRRRRWGSDRAGDSGGKRSAVLSSIQRTRRRPPKATSPAPPIWRFVEGEGWAGAVEQRDGVCFMIAMRGSETGIACRIWRIGCAKERGRRTRVAITMSDYLCTELSTHGARHSTLAPRAPG